MKPKYNSRNFRTSIAGATLVTAIQICIAGSAAAATWTGATSTDWNTGGNWTPAGVPAGANVFINTLTPNIATISAPIAATPVDVFVGQGTGVTGRLDHTAGTAATGGGNWMFVGVAGGTGTYNVADTAGTGGTLTGMGQGSGSMTVGKLFIGGASYNGAGTGTLNVNTSGTITATSAGDSGDNSAAALQLANRAGCNGTLNLDNGTINALGELWIGTAANGTLNQSAGTINNNSWFAVGLRSGSNGIYNLSGGTLNASQTGGFALIASAGGSTGTVNVSGGNFNVASNHQFLIGEGGTGTLNVSNTGTVSIGNITEGLRLGVAGSANGTVNLNGGTILTPIVTKGAGTGTFNFNGGTLKAAASSSTFMQGLSTANVQANGATIDTNGFTVTIGQALAAGSPSGGLTKVGAGTLRLTGSNSFTGSSTVTTGKLLSNNTATSTGSVSVADGAGFGVISNDDFSQLASSSITFGTTGATTLDIDLGNFPGNPATAPLKPGSVVLNGTVSVNITDAGIDLGTIPLVEYTSKTGAGNFAIGTLPLGVTATLTDNGTGLVSLNVTSVALPKWDATVSDAWDTSTANWINQVNTTPSTFSNGNPVLFDDSVNGATAGAVVLNSALSPGEITVNNNFTPYSFTGTGSINGTGGLLKQGFGTLALDTSNGYTGVTNLAGGVTSVNNLANGGSPSSIGASSSSAANFILNSASLEYTGLDASTDRSITISGTGSKISTTNNLTISGQVTGTGGLITKAGAGNLTLSGTGANSLGTGGYPAFRIDQGTLTLDGSGTQTNIATGEFWVGAVPDVAANLVMNNTSLTATSWMTLGRGTGSTGTICNFTATNSTLATGNFSAGFDNNLAGNNSVQNITLTNTNWTNSGAAHLAESANSNTTLTIGGTSEIIANAQFLMGMGDGSICNATIKDSGKLTRNNAWLAVGSSGTGSSGTLTIQDSGTLNCTGGGDFNVGDVGTSQGTVFIKDSATVSVGGNSFIGKGNGTSGTINQTGGTFTGNSFISIGRFAGSTGVINVSAGTFNQTGAGQVVIVGEEGTGTLNISGTASVVTAGTNVIISNAATANGILNLDGGSLTAKQITEGGAGAGSGVLNLNGGVLKAATGANAAFLLGLNAANVKSGGANIDTNGNSIAIAQALLDGGGGGGLTKSGAGTLSLNAANTYTGTTTVSTGTLGGTGSVAGPLVVSAAATIAPGASAGTFTAGNTTLSGTYACEIDGAASDLLAVNGSLSIGSSTLAISQLNAPTTAVFVIASYTSLTGTFASVTGLPSGYSVNYNYNGLNQIALVSTGSAFSSWAATNITAINPSADATTAGDPDGDGLTNLTEFALDGNPLSGASTGRMVGKVASFGGSPALVLTLPVRTGATFTGSTEQVSGTVSGIVYRIQGSDQLGTWNHVISEVTGTDKTNIEAAMPSLGSVDWEYRTFKSSNSPTTDPKAFLRAVIENP